MKSYQRPPWWYVVIIVVMLLPLLLWPTMVTGIINGSYAGSLDSGLVFLFPLYAVATAWLAYRTYAGRPALSIILLAVLALSYAAILIA